MEQGDSNNALSSTPKLIQWLHEDEIMRIISFHVLLTWPNYSWCNSSYILQPWVIFFIEREMTNVTKKENIHVYCICIGYH